jgi:uncharacterized iron-regulated membrane protein
MSRRAVWRWHFYAGLFVAPVLLILAATGAIYLFEREIDGAVHRDALQVAPRGGAADLATQEAAVIAAHPDATLLSMTPPRSPASASRWTLRLVDGAKRELFVDPYLARVQGEIDPDRSLTAVARRVHGTLLSGDAGSYLVELTACWTLVMLLTGVYLWWPANWRLSAFVPRIRARGRAFWRDWHAIPAMFNASLVLLLVLTGLPWSVFWGSQFARLGGTLPLLAPSPNFTTRPPPSVVGLPWVVQHHGAPHASHVPRTSVAVIEPTLARLHLLARGADLKVIYPAAPGDAFIASYVPARAQLQRTVYLDPVDGRLLGDVGWHDYSPTAQAVEWGVMTHTGRQYGGANQLVNLAVCLALIGTTIAGVVLWWKRRPRGRLGAPERSAGERLPRGIVAMLVTLGLLFPLLGATLILVALCDRYAAARLSGLGRPTA